MENISLQLYSIRDYTAKDFVGSIKKVAEFGYKGVEFAGYGGLSATDLKVLLNQTGLTATASHMGLDRLRNNLDEEIEYAKEIGVQYIVCPWSDIKTREDTLKVSEEFTKIIQKCKSNGIDVAYHNHSNEFVKDGEDYLLDILFDNTPELLCELDVFWVSYSGVDVLPYMKKFANRLPLLHLKEISADKTNVDIGKGILDFKAIVDTAKMLGTKGFIVEQEEYEIDSIVSAKNDADYLSKL